MFPLWGMFFFSSSNFTPRLDKLSGKPIYSLGVVRPQGLGVSSMKGHPRQKSAPLGGRPCT
jgi:hypothetical protein